MGEPEKKAELFDQFARVGKALGNGKRLELLDLLAQGERSAGHLADAAGLRLTTASAHLQVLKKAGLVATRHDGTTVYYDLSGTDVAALYARMRTVARDRIPDVRRARDNYLNRGRDGQDAVSQEIDRDELAAAAAAGEVTVIDVRPEEEYRAAHIPRSVSIPVDELARRLHEIPADLEAIVYCRGTYCVLARDALDILRAHGRHARRMNDGMLEWRLAGLPVALGKAA